jgi:hypothetical protein
MATFIAGHFLGLRVFWETSASAVPFSSCDVRGPALAASHNAARWPLCEGQRRRTARGCRCERFGMRYFAC